MDAAGGWETAGSAKAGMRDKNNEASRIRESVADFRSLMNSDSGFGSHEADHLAF